MEDLGEGAIDSTYGEGVLMIAPMVKGKKRRVMTPP